MSAEYTGGCLCGAVRYRAAAEPRYATHCHCAMCRRSSGAPMVTWVAFPTASLTYTLGAPRLYRSSDTAERGFCAACGSQLTFRYQEGSDEIDISAGSLDDPDAIIAPRDHLWTSSQVAWLKIDDDLVRYPRGRDFTAGP